MKSFFLVSTQRVVVLLLWYCISIRSANGIDSIHRPSNDSDASSHSSASTATHDSSTSSRSGGSGNNNKNGSNGRSKYYYNNQNDDSQHVYNKYDDEQTYLDVFGERAKELFTRHIIPFTDVECRWDWIMGRCEPYCSCKFQFLWGDFHLGRSCRLRPNPPPSVNDAEVEESPWQEAWQKVWQSQMEVGTADDVSSFVAPMFPKTQPDVAGTSSWDATSNTCTLPPESRYTQIMNQLTTKTMAHSATVNDKYKKLKNVTSTAVSATIIQGFQLMTQSQHHWNYLRQKSCQIVKSKVEERAKIRNQPVVLTRQGAIWIRRVCGASSDDSIKRADDDQNAED